MTGKPGPTRDDLPDTELLEQSATELIEPTSPGSAPTAGSGGRNRDDAPKAVIGRAGALVVPRADDPGREGAGVRAENIAARALPLLGLALVVAVLGVGGYYLLQPAAGPALNATPPSPPQDSAGAAASERIARILSIAELHLRVGRLSEPEGSNAYAAYSEVLRMDPANARASDGMQKIAQKYADAARALLEEGHPRQALAEVQRALTLFPENSGLLALRDQLVDATAPEN